MKSLWTHSQQDRHRLEKMAVWWHWAARVNPVKRKSLQPSANPITLMCLISGSDQWPAQYQIDRPTGRGGAQGNKGEETVLKWNDEEWEKIRKREKTGGGAGVWMKVSKACLMRRAVLGQRPGSLIAYYKSANWHGEREKEAPSCSTFQQVQISADWRFERDFLRRCPL